MTLMALIFLSLSSGESSLYAPDQIFVRRQWGRASGERMEARPDVFDRILQLRKTGQVQDLDGIFGRPVSARPTVDDPNLEERTYSTEIGTPLHVFVDKSTGKLRSLVLVFWVDFDAYAFLKERFSGFEWKESPKPSKTVDVIEEFYSVEIPQLGITFEYDNQDPLRRPMWIFFN